MSNQFSIGDVIYVDGLPYEIGESIILRSMGAPLSLFAVPAKPKCDAPGCTNPALDHTTQIAPATNVRVCAACAEAL